MLRRDIEIFFLGTAIVYVSRFQKAALVGPPVAERFILELPRMGKRQDLPAMKSLLSAAQSALWLQLRQLCERSVRNGVAGIGPLLFELGALGPRVGIERQ